MNFRSRTIRAGPEIRREETEKKLERRRETDRQRDRQTCTQIDRHTDRQAASKKNNKTFEKLSGIKGK